MKKKKNLFPPTTECSDRIRNYYSKRNKNKSNANANICAEAPKKKNCL